MKGGDSYIRAVWDSASPKDKAEAKLTSVKGNGGEHGMEDIISARN